MTESEINLDKIANLKHRAILQALFSTDLTIQEIARKMLCTTGAVYYCVSRYLYNGYCEKRTRRIQMSQLSDCAASQTAAQSAESKVGSDDLVTEVKLEDKDSSEIKALPAAAEPQNDSASTAGVLNEPGRALPHSYDISSNNRSSLVLTPVQLQIYDFIKSTISRYPRNYFISINKFYYLYKKTYGTGFSRRDYYLVRKKMAADRKAAIESRYAVQETSPCQNTVMPAANDRNLSTRASPSNLLRLEFRGMTLSLNYDGSTACVEQILGLIRNMISMKGAD